MGEREFHSSQDAQRTSNLHLEKVYILCHTDELSFQGSSNCVTGSEQALENTVYLGLSLVTQALTLAGWHGSVLVSHSISSPICWQVSLFLYLLGKNECFQDSYRHSQQKATT